MEEQEGQLVSLPPPLLLVMVMLLLLNNNNQPSNLILTEAMLSSLWLLPLMLEMIIVLSL